MDTDSENVHVRRQVVNLARNWPVLQCEPQFSCSLRTTESPKLKRLMTASRWYQSWWAKTISSFGLDPAHHFRRAAPTAASTDANDGTRLLEDPSCELMWTSVTRRHQRIGPTGAGLIRPRDLVPSHSRRRADRCWPSAGLRGGQRRSHRMFSGLRVVACHCGGTEDWGSLSRL